MVSAYNTIALVQSTEFKWTAQIQYKESLPSREAAIRYAGLHGCNLIVKYDRRSGPLFDVMHDPNGASASEAYSDSTETISVVIEPERSRWSRMMARSLFGFARRFATATSSAN